MAHKDPRHARRVHKKWLARNQLRTVGARQFRRIPPFFGSSLVTGVIVGLVINGPAKKVDFFRTIATNYPPLTRVLDRLEHAGIVTRTGRRRCYVYTINREHVAYAALADYCQRIAMDYPIPVWKARDIADAQVRQPLPDERSCRWFGSARTSNALLFIYALHGARLRQLRMFFKERQGMWVPKLLDNLVRAGVIFRLATYAYDPVGFAYVLDPRFRYHRELVALLDALLVSYPSIVLKAKACRDSYRGTFRSVTRSL